MSGYQSRLPDQNGRYAYDREEDSVWGELFRRQISFLQGRVAPAYLQGVEKLGLNDRAVPQVAEIDARLRQLTGAGVKGVPAIIPPTEFFALLSQRRFPVATFLRRREDMDYIEEPDLFHEVFGHCPLLTDPGYVGVIERFGHLAVDLGKPYAWRLFRLFWFTIEFGMIHTPGGLRAYGAGIVSSPAEAAHATGGGAEMLPFDLMTVLRTPYRIDILQPVYFAIDSFDQLAATLSGDVAARMDEARAMGDLPARFDKAA
jgi:phenylalanine-4-hydroxylase